MSITLRIRASVASDASAERRRAGSWKQLALAACVASTLATTAPIVRSEVTSACIRKEEPGSALYSPFSTVAKPEPPSAAVAETTSSSRPPNDVEPSLAVTYVSCLASVVALVWLLLRL